MIVNYGDYDIGTRELKNDMRRVRPGKILRDGRCCMILACIHEEATRSIGSMMTTTIRKAPRLRAGEGEKSESGSGREAARIREPYGLSRISQQCDDRRN